MSEVAESKELKVEKTLSSGRQGTPGGSTTQTDETNGKEVVVPEKTNKNTSGERTEEPGGRGAMNRASLPRNGQYPYGRGYSSRKGYPFGSKNSSQKIDLGDGKYVNRKTCRGKMQYCVIKCMTLCQCGIGITILLSFMLLLVIAKKGVDHHFRKTDPWELLPPPHSVSFEEYSISSSNEYCNELLRMTVQEDQVAFVALGWVMDFCLSITEPQAGGLGGDSVTVYMDAKKNKCKQIRAVGTESFVKTDNEFLDTWKSIILKELVNNLRASERGPWSTRPPGHSLFPISIHDLLLLTTNDSVASKTLSYMDRLYDSELRKTILVVSPRLDKALTQAISLRMFAYHSAPNLMDDWKRGMEEGDYFRPSYEAIKASVFWNPDVETESFRKELIYYFTNNYQQAFINANMDMQQVRQHFYHLAMQFSATMDPNLSFVSEGELVQLEDDVTVCSPLPGYNQTESFVANMLKNFNQSKAFHAAETTLQHDSTTQNYRTPMLGAVVEQFFNFQEKISKFVNSTQFEYDTEFEKKMKEVYEEMKRTGQAKRKRPNLTGNYFVIVKHSTGEALASTSTIGSAFGSEIGYDGIMLNNFNRDILRPPLNRTGPFLRLMEPLILVNRKEKTIRMAYAGPPGHPIASLDMPRKMTALTLAIYFKQRLEEALTVPLAFTDDGKSIRVTNGIPFQNQAVLESNSGKGRAKIRRRKADLTDEAAAVDGHRAIQFDGRGGQIMPNGF